MDPEDWTEGKRVWVVTNKGLDPHSMLNYKGY